MAQFEFSVVKDSDSILHQPISNHPDLQNVEREVVLLDVRISAKNGYDRGFFINYYMNHYIDGVHNKSFLKQTKEWTIDDNIQIAKRDLNTFEPIADPNYEKAVAANKLKPTITNPEYISDTALKKVPKTLPNPDYINEEETPYVEPTLPNPDYAIAEMNNTLPPTLPNPDYISDDMLDLTPKYLMEPAFTYILSVVKQKPELLFVLLGFYIAEQDRDGFFNQY